MKRLVFGTLLLILVCLPFTLPPARSAEVRTYTLRSKAWNIDYTISDVRVNPGQIVTLDINFTANVLIYDLKLEVLSNPVQLVTGPPWGFKEIRSSLLQRHTFQVKIPDDAARGSKYNLDLLLQGYNDPPWFDLFGWRPHGLLFWVEQPQYTGDTRGHEENSIVITVI